MISFDKKEVKEALSLDNIYDLLQEWGGNPIYSSFGLISATICHNPIGEGSHKLYYYENSRLCVCYTGCDEHSFDIFELAIKVFKIQENRDIDLNEAVRYIALRFGISGTLVEDNANENADWEYLENYSRIQNITINSYTVTLEEYDKTILSNLNYKVRIMPWLQEGISQKVMDMAQIGYFPADDQITIPHFDKDGRFIGLRGRNLCKDDVERLGKYRPVFANQVTYKHPIGMNLYGLNWAKDNIAKMGKAIVVESEKSVLKYISYFGLENDICVACCGSSFSFYQLQLVLELH